MPRDEVQLSNAPPLPPHCFEISVAQQVFMCVCVCVVYKQGALWP